MTPKCIYHRHVPAGERIVEVTPEMPQGSVVDSTTELSFRCDTDMAEMIADMFHGHIESSCYDGNTGVFTIEINQR